MRRVLEGWFNRLWWQPRPTWVARCLRPLAALLQWLAERDRQRAVVAPPDALAAPVVVVGNLIVGGAGKTPTVIALVQALRARGWHPGVISRGYGRASQQVQAVDAQSSASEVGDEPLLIHLRTGAPVCVGRDRVAAARQLLADHPQVNVLVSDDGLQHWRLPRQAQVLVFDGRGLGNGLTLPAGPLRQRVGVAPPARSLVLYNAARPSTAWPGALAQRRLGGAVALSAWWAGERPDPATLADLASRSRQAPPLAVAGMAEPERFFGMLEAAGLHIRRRPLPDHAVMWPLPWPADTTEVVLTEKDAVKLRPEQLGATRVWVVALDFRLPCHFIDALEPLLRSGGAPAALPHEP